ncbi:MAG: sulfotransferase [Synechococcus sp.]
MGSKPDFLFIGAMKSATTTISSQLDAQPGIFMVSKPDKEIYYFSYDNNYERGMDWYTAHFDPAESGDICGEAATTYTQLPTYPKAAERLYQDLPDAKLIYLMRHPIDRLISHYMHEYTMRTMSVDINEAIHQYPNLVDYSKYAMQLKPYIERFKHQQILPSFFERIKSEPQAELERICQFIGYSDTPTWDFDMKAKNASNERVMEGPMMDFLRKSPVTAGIRALLPKGLKFSMRKALSPNIEKPVISTENIEFLKSVFDEDLAELGAWMGLELSCDTFTSAVTEGVPNWADAYV